MASLKTLANRLEKKALAINAASSKLSVEIAIAVVTDLTNKTPVDTSQAMSNWTVSLQSPATGRVKAHFVGIAGSTQKASAAETIAQAKKVLENKKANQTIFITNNLPYIKRLNDGYSKQQPAGFVERAVLIGRKMQKNFKIKG